MTIKMISDMNSGKIIESQVSHPQWFQRLAEQKLRYIDENRNYEATQHVQPIHPINNNYFTKTSTRKVYEYHSDGNASPRIIIPTVSTNINTNKHMESEVSQTNFQPTIIDNMNNRYKLEKNYRQDDVISSQPVYSDSYFNLRNRQSSSSNYNTQLAQESPRSIHVTFDSVNSENSEIPSIPPTSSLINEFFQNNSKSEHHHDIPIVYRFGNTAERRDKETLSQKESRHEESFDTRDNIRQELTTQKSIEKQTPRPIKSNRKHSIYNHLREEVDVMNYNPRVVVSETHTENVERKKEMEISSPAHITGKMSEHEENYEQQITNSAVSEIYRPGSINSENSQTNSSTSSIRYRPAFISSPSRYNTTYWSSLNKTETNLNDRSQTPGRHVNERCRQGVRYCGHTNERKTKTIDQTENHFQINPIVIKPEIETHREESITVERHQQNRHPDIYSRENIESRNEYRRIDEKEENIQSNPVYVPAINVRTDEELIETGNRRVIIPNVDGYLHLTYNRTKTEEEEEEEAHRINVNQNLNRHKLTQYNSTSTYTREEHAEQEDNNRNYEEGRDYMRNQHKYSEYSSHIYTGRNSSNLPMGSGNDYLIESERPRDVTPRATTTTTAKPTEIPSYVRPPKVKIHKNRGDQPPQQFEEDYDFDDILEKEPGIGYYPVGTKPEIGLKEDYLDSEQYLRNEELRKIALIEQNREEERRRNYQHTLQVNLNPTASTHIKDQYHYGQTTNKTFINCRKPLVICYIKKN